MYDTSVRILAPPNRTATNEKVGPSTYVICNPRSRKQNYAPFLSSQTREPSFVTKSTTDAIYNVRSYDGIIKGGSSLRNKASRFVYKADDTAGPTKYTAKPPQWIKKKLKLDPTKPKIYACAVPYSVTCSAPSIPTKINENGYDLDSHGNIIKVPPDDPEYIELNIKPTFPKERGCKWSGRTSKRFSRIQYLSAGPGPAAYDVQIPMCRRCDDEEYIREMARRLSFVPRFLEAQEAKITREALPGPGHYDFLRPPSDRAKSINPRPFITNSGRFKGLVSDTPAPTKYKICDCYRAQKRFSVKSVPFGVGASRFTRRRVKVLPGPGDYKIKSGLEEKVDYGRYAILRPPFNTTRERVTFEDREAELRPSPATYPVEDEESDEEIMEIYASVFMSTVERFRDKELGVSPARYNVAESFEKSRDRKCFSAAKLPFSTSGPRSTTPTVKTGVPCPTTYRNELGVGDAGHHFNTSPRFPYPDLDRPGPGSYAIHPGYDLSMYGAWATHNLKLKENVLRKKLKLPPHETRTRWVRMLKKKKVLKWFNVGPDFEERMAALIIKLFDKPL